MFVAKWVVSLIVVAFESSNIAELLHVKIIQLHSGYMKGKKINRFGKYTGKYTVLYEIQ